MTMTLDISTRILPLQYTAVMRGEVRPAEMSRWLTRTYHTVSDYLRRTRTAAVGPPFARYTYLADVVAVEAGFPVASEVQGEGQVEPSTLPAGDAAVATHRGRFDELDRTYQGVRGWLDHHGLVAAGAHWEVYYTEPYVTHRPEHWRTAVVVPYRLRGRSAHMH